MRRDWLDHGQCDKEEEASHVRLAEIGEFALIARLTKGLESRPDVVLGVGDDAAALDLGADQLLLATCDTQVEGRHFLMRVATAREIGHKALAVNLSDIAAMGGEPLWALVSMIAPPDLDVSVVDGIYEGMRALAARYRVAIVGGNVSSTSGPLTLDITLLGRVPQDRILTRAGARPGDRLLVTGSLGAGRVGLRAVTSSGIEPPPDTLARVRAHMVTPEPRVREGMALAATGGVTAMLDISDGLAGDLGHICERSNVGALVDAAALPVDEATRAVALALGDDPVALALSGGDDYELLFTARPEDVQRVTEAAGAMGTPVTVIGEITAAEAGLRVRQLDGSIHALTPRGWDHLAPDGAG
jgi:thiamine-monophosphate kinase